MTETRIIKRIRQADATAARHAPGSAYHTRAINDGKLWRKRLACWRATGSFTDASSYQAEDAGL